MPVEGIVARFVTTLLIGIDGAAPGTPSKYYSLATTYLHSKLKIGRVI